MTKSFPVGQLSILRHSRNLTSGKKLGSYLSFLHFTNSSCYPKITYQEDPALLQGSIFFFDELPDAQLVIGEIQTHLKEGEWVALAEFVNFKIRNQVCEIYLVTENAWSSVPPMGTLNFLAEQMGIIEVGASLPDIEEQ